jgi:hypothetical protein
MEYTEISESDGKFFIGMCLVFENEAMTRTVHRLQAKSLRMVMMVFVF